jgi:predicted SAM-dependent methyltransferase
MSTTDTLRRLNWGCGHRGRPGWLNSDLKVGDGIDLSEDIRHGLSIESDSLDYVVSIHALPMIPYPDLVPVLRELRRTLKPTGVLRLALPDLDKGIRAYQDGDLSHFLVPDSEVRSPGGKFIVQMLWYGYSVSLFTADFIEELLGAAGFEDVRHCGFRETNSQLVGITDLDDRETESLFVEATKPAHPSPGSAPVIFPATHGTDASIRPDPLTKGMTSMACPSRGELELARSFPNLRHQRELLHEMEKSYADAGSVESDGYCLVCDDATTFRSSLDRADLDGAQSHWTERLQCGRCGMNDRERAMYWFALQTAETIGKEIYVAERTRGVYPRLRRRIGPSVAGGEHPGAGQLGAVMRDDGLPSAPRIPVPDGHLDLLVSLHVLEHVDEPTRVIDDLWRALRPGGQLLLTTSFFPDQDSNVLRARRVDGAIAFTEFGWELVDDLREWFSTVTPELYQSWQYGHLGPEQLFLRCIR